MDQKIIDLYDEYNRQENTALRRDLQELRHRLMAVERRAFPPQLLPRDHVPQR